MKLLIKKLRQGAVIPKCATPGSAGYDLSACIDSEICIKAGETVKVGTGISAELSDAPECALLIFARSSLATKAGLAPANCVGVVDSDYRGEIIVPLHNHSDKECVISPGERIAQLVMTPIFKPEVCEVDKLSETERGAGGFGSTNREDGK